MRYGVTKFQAKAAAGWHLARAQVVRTAGRYSFSESGQDMFVLSAGAPVTSTFLDIGSAHAIASRNTYALDRRGWQGVAVERDPRFRLSYLRRRNTRFVCADALSVDYATLFRKIGLPPIIDYLSLDVDEASLDVLQRLPHDHARFRIITVEHDRYIYGDMFRDSQRRYLNGLGYRLLCSDVLAHLGRDDPYEDWWVAPEFFDEDWMSRVSCDGEHISTILPRLAGL